MLVPLSNHGRETGLHTPLMSPQGTDIAMGLARCHMTHTLKQKKGVVLSLKQGNIFPHKAIRMAQAVRVSYLLVRKCSRSKALSGQAWGGATGQQ